MITKGYFDLDVCKKEGLSVRGFLYILALYYNEYFKDTTAFKETLKKCYITYWGYDEDNPDRVALTADGYKAVESILLDSEFKEETKKGVNFEALAKKLQEIYPEGKKQGTNYYWRDNINTIVKKLKTMVKKFGDNFTEDQAVEATKRYVQSFNGQYTYMQLLKYFICKNAVKGGEIEEQSQLMSYIENAGQEDSHINIDWETELR